MSDLIEPGMTKDSVRFNLPDGVVIEATHKGDCIELRGCGNSIGCLAIEPHGSNLVDVKVVQ